MPQLVAKWGGGIGAGHASSPQAQEPGQFRSPWGIAVDGQGDVFVTDTANQRIQKFDRDGNFITQWGGFGNSQGHFNFPYGIGIDAKGCVFAVDSGNMRVQHFMQAEEAVDIWKEGKTTTSYGLADSYAIHTGGYRFTSYTCDRHHSKPGYRWPLSNSL